MVIYNVQYSTICIIVIPYRGVKDPYKKGKFIECNGEETNGYCCYTDKKGKNVTDDPSNLGLYSELTSLQLLNVQIRKNQNHRMSE